MPGGVSAAQWDAAFVAVRDGQFYLNDPGRSFSFTGTNAYWLMASEDWGVSSRPVLRNISQAGIRVVRTWGFDDGVHKVQKGIVSGQGEVDRVIKEGSVNNGRTAPSPAETTRVVANLRKVVDAAYAHHIKLILPLTNYWADYGGVLQYVCWADAGPGDNATEGMDPELLTGQPFYQKVNRFWDESSIGIDVDIFNDVAAGKNVGSRAQQLFKDYVTAVVGEFRDHPGVFAWEIGNELRFQSGGDRTRVAKFVSEIATLVKSIDPKHLVTVGVEGFMDPGIFNDGKIHNSFNSFTDEATTPIDFAQIHMYPYDWAPERDAKQFATDWIQCHARICKGLGKPLLLGEFGYPQGAPGCADFFRHVYNEAAKALLGGTLYWQWGDKDNSDYYSVAVGEQTMTAIKQQVAQTNRAPVRPFRTLPDL